MDVLPNEMLVHILYFIPITTMPYKRFNEIKSYRLVNRRFDLLIRDCYKIDHIISIFDNKVFKDIYLKLNIVKNIKKIHKMVNNYNKTTARHVDITLKSTSKISIMIPPKIIIKINNKKRCDMPFSLGTTDVRGFRMSCYDRPTFIDIINKMKLNDYSDDIINVCGAFSEKIYDILKKIKHINQL
jgi:hypothetical protein